MTIRITLDGAKVIYEAHLARPGFPLAEQIAEECTFPCIVTDFGGLMYRGIAPLEITLGELFESLEERKKELGELISECSRRQADSKKGVR